MDIDAAREDVRTREEAGVESHTCEHHNTPDYVSKIIYVFESHTCEHHNTPDYVSKIIYVFSECLGDGNAYNAAHAYHASLRVRRA
jgi:hypothetical protein